VTIVNIFLAYGANMKTISFIWLAGILIVTTLSTAKAGSDETDLQSLQQAVQALQERVEVLEAIKPTFTGFMPNIAERFHVLHRAGEAGDWAVAGHELAEMKRLVALSGNIDTKNGVLMQSMMESSFQSLEDAVEHGNQEKLQMALEETVNACNACHTATGSPFVQIVLDAKSSISMRHPHALAQREMARGHSHGDPAMMQTMQKQMKSMMGAEAGEGKHDDSNEDGHHDDDEKHQD
jgi:hypothetical protein